MSFYLAPVTLDVPVLPLAGTGISLMPYVYDGSSYVPNPIRPRIRDLQPPVTDAAGNVTTPGKPIFDPASAAAVAQSFRAQGFKHCVLDWELHPYGGASPANVQTIRDIMGVFKGLGVAVSLHGSGSDGGGDAVTKTLAADQKWMCPEWYAHTPDPAKWVADRTAQLLKLRKNHRLDVCAVLQPFTNDQASAPLPVGYWKTMLDWAVANCDHVCVWVHCFEAVPGGGFRDTPFDAAAEWFGAYKQAAKGK